MLTVYEGLYDMCTSVCWPVQLLKSMLQWVKSKLLEKKNKGNLELLVYQAADWVLQDFQMTVYLGVAGQR